MSLSLKSYIDIFEHFGPEMAELDFDVAQHDDVANNNIQVCATSFRGILKSPHFEPLLFSLTKTSYQVLVTF